MKVVINRCFGGFGLSFEACKKYLNSVGKNCVFYKGGFKDKKRKIDTPTEGDWDVNISTKDLGDVIDDIPREFFWYSGNIEDRSDPALIAIVEELGDKANTRFSRLKIVTIPDGIKYEIDDYDGSETIHEVHHSWY